MGALFSFIFSATYFLPSVYYARTPATLSVRVDGQPRQTRHESLRTFLESRCPSVLREFVPAWWLFISHLQVAHCVFGDFSRTDRVEYDRTLLRTVDGGTIALDFTPRESNHSLDDDAPIVVVMHGLTGGSHESYVRAVLAPACTPVERGGLGYRGVVMIFRGCSGVPLTSPQLYSAGYTDDIRVAVYYIRKRYPRAPLLGLGFSAGANVLTRYLAEEGTNCRLIAGCVLACPWDMAISSDRLEGKWFHRHVYSTGMGCSFQDIIRQNASRLRAFTAHPVSSAAAATIALRRPTMRQFDEHMTRIIGGASPPFPMPSVTYYYRWSSSVDLLEKIRIPFLAINAEDDPVVQADPPYDVRGNPWVALVVTKKGGHLGWFQSVGGMRVERWSTKPVVEWLRAVGEDLVPGAREENRLCEVNEFLTEEGRYDIGCRRI